MNAIACIDEPTHLERVGIFLSVKGWIIDPKTVGAELYIDNKILGEIKPFIHRQDVLNAYPHISIHEPTGFDEIFEIPKLSPGKHTIYLKSKHTRPQLFNQSGNNTVKEPGDTLFTRQIYFDNTFDYNVKTIDIEFSRKCNFHCDMCPAHSIDSKYNQKEIEPNPELLDRILPFIVDAKYAVKNVGIGSMWGEPLMITKFFDNLSRFRQIFHKYSIELLPFTTNGSFLTDSNIDRILKLNFIKQIAISVDAGTKDTYESIRKGGKWETLIENISNLISEKRRRKLERPIVCTNFVVMKNNFKELPQYINKMVELGVDRIGAVNAHSCYSTDYDQGIFDLPWKINEFAEEREPILEDSFKIHLPEKTSLYLPSFTPKKYSTECSFKGASTMVIGIEGEAYPCCVLQSLDYEGRKEAEAMGNIFERKLEKIWNNDKFIEFRLKMLRGHPPNSICLNCPFFYGM